MLLSLGLIALIVLAAVTLVRLGDLTEKLRTLDDRLRRMESRLGGAPARPSAKTPPARPARAEKSAAAQPPETAPGASPPTEPRPETPRPTQQAPSPAPAVRAAPLPRVQSAPAQAAPAATAPVLTEARIGQRGLLIAGIIVMVLGVGYFLQYSFQQGWVSPSMRVLTTYLGGIALLIAGEAFRRRNYAPFGLTLAGGGIVTFYFATFAGYAMYDLLPAAPAFLLMIAVTALAGTLAIVYDNRWLAVVGLVGGFLTPLLIHTADPSAPGLFAYLAILNAGVLGISFFREWRMLLYLGAAATWFVYAVWFATGFSAGDFWWALSFANFAFLIYALAPILYSIRKDTAPGPAAWSLIIPNTAAATGFGLVLMAERYSVEAGGILTLLYAAFFTALGTWLQRRRPGAADAFTVCVVKGIVFTGLTIPLIFSGPWVAAFWALAGGAMAWAGGRLGNRWVFAMAFLLTAAAALRLYAFDYPETFRFQDFAAGFADGWSVQAVVRWIVAVAVGAAIAAVWRVHARISIDSSGASGLLAFVTGAHVFAVLNIETQGFFLTYAPPAAAAAISVLWALCSIGLMGIGFRMRQRQTRWIAILLFAATLGKVLLVDMAEAATPFRILSSIALGVLMIAGSFLYHRFKDIVDPDKPEKGKPNNDPQ